MPLGQKTHLQVRPNGAAGDGSASSMALHQAGFGLIQPAWSFPSSLWRSPTQHRIWTIRPKNVCVLFFIDSYPILSSGLQAADPW